MVIAVVKVAVACSEMVATDTQSTRVEHIPEGEGEEVET